MANQLPRPQAGEAVSAVMVSAWVTVLNPISFEPPLAVGSTCLNGGRGKLATDQCVVSVTAPIESGTLLRWPYEPRLGRVPRDRLPF